MLKSPTMGSILMSSIDPAAAASKPTERFRVEWLDGVRACAALFVVLHHSYLMVFPGFPVNNGAPGLGFVMYGHLAVVVFIVVSGFSLGLAPTRRRNDLKHGSLTFYHRRAWRILPPYWMALILALLMHWFLLPAAGLPVEAQPPNFRSLFVFGLLLQDIVPAPTPNGAFWSIAVEAHIYIFFPLMIVLSQRFSPKAMVACSVAILVSAQLLATTGPPFDRLDHLSLALYVAFTFGVWAASEVSQPTQNLPMLWIGAALAAALAVTLWANGVVFLLIHSFWVDVAAGLVVAILFVGLIQTPCAFGRFLSLWPISKLGSFAYSLYLTHNLVLPFVIGWLWIGPFYNPYLSYFSAIAVAVPATILFAYLFFLLFERPFLTIRSWAQLRQALGLARKSRKLSPNPLAGASD